MLCCAQRSDRPSDAALWPFSVRSLYRKRPQKMVVHPPSMWALRLASASQLRPGEPAAPGIAYLPLLSSDPDGVRRFPPRKTRSSTPLDESSPTGSNLGQEFNPAVADCGYRAPLAPRLARPGYILAYGGGFVKYQSTRMSACA